MNEKIILDKLDLLAKQKEQVLAQFNAILGAEQVLNELLAEIKKGDTTDE